MTAQIKTEDAAGIANVILRDKKRLDKSRRERIARELASLPSSTLRVSPDSVEQHPDQPSILYVMVDVAAGDSWQPLLMEIAPIPATSDLFLNPAIVERSIINGDKVMMNFYPFSTIDRDNIRTFASQVNPAYLPRPQRALPAIAAGNRHPEISLPAVFNAYRTILEKLRVNMASTVQLSATREMTTEDVLCERSGDDPTAIGHTRVSIRHLYDSGLWAAARAGWREGYTAEADHFIVSGNTPDEIARSIEFVKTAIQHAAGYTKFTTDSSRMFELEADPRHPNPWSDSAVADKFQQVLARDEQAWVLNEFSKTFKTGKYSYKFEEPEIKRLAVKFGRSLKLNEELFDAIAHAKEDFGGSAEFDFEPSIDEAETLTTPRELLFYMHFLKQRGRPAQLCPPNLGFKKRQAYPAKMETTAEHGVGLDDYAHGKMWPELTKRVREQFGGSPLEELAARVAELAAVARHFDTTLSIHSGSGKQAEVLERIGKSTGGRVNYKISGELQLQLFDVLSQQPADSRWRQLFERMVNRANAFAAKGAFGYESELAQKYIEMGREFYLGDSTRGRVDGNLFLVFWLGNLVGTSDADSPDGDHRFFKEKLDELPQNLLDEVRHRNAHYVVWLADHLQG